MRTAIQPILAGLLVLLVGEAVAGPPKVNHLFPAGGQRGQSVSVKLSGEFSTWPVQIWSDHPGVSATAEEEKGKVAVQVAADAQPGVAWLRFHNAEGASTLQPFIVGHLPEIEEEEPNDAPSNPQEVAARTVVNGRLQKGGDVDSFKVSLKQGETLVAALQAHSILGSPVDSVLQICQLIERKALADAPVVVEAYALQQEHDSVGLDPRLVFTAPKDGVYLLRIFGFPSEPNANIAYSGGDNYIYRLTLTTGSYVAAALPMAVKAGESTAVKLLGWNLPGEGLQITSTPAGGNETQTPKSDRPTLAAHPEAAGFVHLSSVNHATTVAHGTNGQDAPQQVSLPLTVSGQLREPGASHSFIFEAAKGQKVRANVEASSLGFPWDPHLSVVDESGKILAENDDAKKERDPQVILTSPADGKYRVLVRDLNRSGGLEFVYHLTIEPVAPDFSLSLATDSFIIAADRPVEIPVSIDRRDGFAEPVIVRAVGLPQGITVEEVTSDATGDTSKAVKLILKAEGDLSAAVSAPFIIEGTAKNETKRVSTFGLSKPFAGDHTGAWLTISR